MLSNTIILNCYNIFIMDTCVYLLGQLKIVVGQYYPSLEVLQENDFTGNRTVGQ